MKAKVNLCKCNQCGQVHIDTNPQINAKFWEIETEMYKELQNNPKFISSQHFCPSCNTDDYLSDDVTELDVKEQELNGTPFLTNL